jgi:phenylacetic acid degradation operon negative regulatory protein
LGLRPLTARSVILSVLLGSHPARLPARALVRLGEGFDISEGTLRVALSRMAADGEVVAADGWYDLSGPLLDRQRRLDEGRAPQLRPWRGAWEMAVAPPSPPATGAGPERSAEADLALLRLAPLRDGVWLRPANLARPWPATLAAGWVAIEARPAAPALLAGRLWDLAAWAATAVALDAGLAAEGSPAGRFTWAAAIARHLRADPVLPRSLLPDGWPGPALRRAYGDYERELRRRLRAVTPAAGT